MKKNNFNPIRKARSKQYIALAHKGGLVGKDLNFICKEAYNLLRTNVSFSFPELESQCKIIGVTSAVPNEGKSYTAINLAASWAEAGKKVLLVNGDMRNSSYSEVFDQPENPGLSNLFIDSSLDVIRQSEKAPGLDIIFAGAFPPNPGELIGSKQFKALLDEYKTKYECIILDLPPVNVVSDALVASKVVDGMLLVVRQGLSNRKEIVNAIGQLKFVKANIIGFVYNDFASLSSRYGYKSKYYKKYKYGYEYSYGYGYGQPNNQTNQQKK